MPFDVRNDALAYSTLHDKTVMYTVSTISGRLTWHKLVPKQNIVMKIFLMQFSYCMHYNELYGQH
jgi:hypothetical protein